MAIAVNVTPHRRQRLRSRRWLAALNWPHCWKTAWAAAGRSGRGGHGRSSPLTGAFTKVIDGGIRNRCVVPTCHPRAVTN